MFDLTELLKTAITQGATDIHITVGTAPKFRIHGRLHTSWFQKPTAADTLGMLLDIMNPEQREQFEEDGEIDLSITIPQTGRCRVNAFKQKNCIALSCRVVDMEIPKAEELGIPEHVMDLCNERNGLILVTGPAGSGKSTVLAAMIDKINSTREMNIITLEDPIEYLHPHKLSIVNQREIGRDTKSCQKAIAAALREDPDIIEIGELSDGESAFNAMKAAELGCLVMSTMYTSGAAETVEAFLAMFQEARQKYAARKLSEVLKAVISRQLIPNPDGTALVPAYEILYVTNQVRKDIREGNYDNLKKVMSAQKDMGMITMDEYLTELYREGKISKESALQYARDTETVTGIL